MITIVYHGIEGKFIPNLEYEKLIEKIDKQSRLIEDLVEDINS